MQKIKVTAVSYLNTKPFLYGIFNNGMEAELELSLDIPSVCADKLKSGEADMGLVPVAVIPELATPHIISDYCIGADGPVKTVAIFGDCKIQEMKAIYLDHHSRTSVELAKWLLREHWKIKPRLLPASEGYINKIGGRTGGLVIGDRTVGLSTRFAYTYDLGEAWQSFSGLPFVFAAWVSNRPLPGGFIKRFNAALQNGIEQIPKLVYLIPPPAPDFDLAQYFTRFISYDLDARKRKALSMFLQELKTDISQPSLAGSLGA